jgi:ribosomal RNA assembly protein
MNEETEFTYELKIPEERVAVLIGKNGETKRMVEEELNCNLDISSDGEVEIIGDDGFAMFTGKEVIKAIGRGFNPKIAILLTKPDYEFELISLKDVTGKSTKSMFRVKSRMIGSEGKARKEIERLTSTHIVVYGKTVGIIGETNNVSLTKQAINMLLNGAMHSTVFRFLEKKKKELLIGK